MGAEIGLVPMNQISQSSQSQHRHKNQLPQQPNPNPINTAASSSSSSSPSPTSWMMWNPTEEEEEEESWEVRAFAEDTRNIMGTTWPPRSYTCTFCRREFRSAQALGGHMNVHRRDRARLHQAHHHQPGSVKPTSSPALVANAGLCLLYHLPSPNTTTVAAFTAPTNNINGEEYSTQYSPSTLLPISSSSYPVPNNNLNMMMQTCSSPFQAMPHPIHHSSSSYCCNNNYSSRVEQQQPATSTSIDNGHLEELDLELRLGHKPPPT